MATGTNALAVSIKPLEDDDEVCDTSVEEDSMEIGRSSIGKALETLLPGWMRASVDSDEKLGDKSCVVWSAACQSESV